MQRLAHLPSCIVFYNLSKRDRACLAVTNKRFSALQHEWHALFSAEIKAASKIQRCWRLYFNLNMQPFYGIDYDKWDVLFVNWRRRTSFHLQSTPARHLNRLPHSWTPASFHNRVGNRHLFALCKLGDLLRRIRIQSNAKNILNVELVSDNLHPCPYGRWTFENPRQTLTLSLCLPIVRMAWSNLHLIVTTLAQPFYSVQVQGACAFLRSGERDAIVAAPQVTCNHPSDKNVLLRFRAGCIVDFETQGRVLNSFMV